MKTALLALALLASPALAQPVEELPAGTALPDGTVAGEKQALDFLKRWEPELHAPLAAMEPKRRRARYGAFFVWFQRVGNYRKRQKAEMVRKIREQLAIDAQLDALKAGGGDAARRALRDCVVAQFESDVELGEWELLSLEEGEPAAAGEIARLKREIAERRRERTRIVDARVAELLAGR